jgi:hypothetical protein
MASAIASLSSLHNIAINGLGIRPRNRQRSIQQQKRKAEERTQYGDGPFILRGVTKKSAGAVSHPLE